MIRHSTYVIIAAVVVLMFFLFQIAIFNMGWNNDVVANNDYEAINISVNDKVVPQAMEEQPLAYIIVSPNTSAPVIEKMLNLLKCLNNTVSSLDELPADVPDGLTGLIINEGNLDKVGNIDVLWNYVHKGVNVIFTRVLDTSSENYKKYYERFGIMNNFGKYDQAGIDFLNKLLVSGMFFNANITTSANMVNLDGTCLIYAVGYDERIKEYKDKNPMIWRTFYDNAFMYFYNCELIDDFGYMGVFAGLISMDKDVFVYPIVNTGVVMLDYLPYFSSENENKIEELYNRDIVQLQRDVIWNDFISITKNLDIKYTIYPYVGTNQDELEKKMLDSFGKAIAVNKFEFGIYPSKIFKNTFPSYKTTSAMHYQSFDMQNQIMFNSSSFGYTADKKLMVPIITQLVPTDKNMSVQQKELAKSVNKFKGFSIASAMGYISHYANVNDVFSNTGNEENWSNYKLDFIQDVYPLFATYNYIQPETVSSAANKLNIYLNCTPKVLVAENEIVINGQDIGDITYIIRTLRKIVNYENCTLKKLSSEYYVVTVRKNTNAIIRTKRED